MKNYIPIFFMLFFQLSPILAQEVETLTVSDYDLRGNVKTCLVITDYGRELFEFNEEGMLTKTVTQYNESDQDITIYRYTDGELVEKRMESYKNNVLDESTSMANFYTLDTVPQRRVLEKIISYDKLFLEQQEYQFDDSGQLTKIITSSADGVDETTCEYTPYKDELTKSIFHNGILEKSIRTSQRKTNSGEQKVVLTKEFIDGEPNTAEEEIFDSENRLLTNEVFLYDPAEKKFVSQKKLLYQYENGVLQKTVTETATTKSEEEYIFQFDSSPFKNWVKQIITPGNAYTTRIIKYYPEDTIVGDPNR